jgi:glycosyltransferase involved in cell wall biosynthesis
MSAVPPSLSIVIPMYEEAENVAPMLARVHEGLADYGGPWELICVDDGSRDGTGERLRKEAAGYGAHVRIIRLRRNFGQTAAMQAGFDAARGGLIATLDGDLQNDPADIPRMVGELIERDLDLLQGWRRERQDGLLLRKIPSRIANRLIAKVTGVRLHDYGCSLKVYRAEVIQRVRLFGEMHRFIPVWVAGVTDPQRMGETVVHHEARRFGRSKYGISRTFRVLLDLLAAFFFLRYRARPGHFFGSIGLVFGAIGALIMAHLTVVKFAFGEDIGQRPLLFIGILFLVAAVQLLSTGVLAELLSRTFFESAEHKSYCVAWESAPTQATWRTPA